MAVDPPAAPRPTAASSLRPAPRVPWLLVHRCGKSIAISSAVSGVAEVALKDRIVEEVGYSLVGIQAR